MSEKPIDQVKKPTYSPNSSTPKDAQAGGMNISSLMNVFAVMMAEGSGDPQVKAQVMENLAKRRAAVEAEAANKQAFENEAEQLAYRQKLSVAGEAQAEQDVPSKEAGARKAQSEARVQEGLETGQVARGNAENKLGTVVAKEGLDDKAARDAARQLPVLDKKLKELEINYKQLQVANAADPRLKELEKEMKQLEVEKAKYDVLKSRAEVMKAGGGMTSITPGLTVQQHLKGIKEGALLGGQDEASRMPDDMQRRIAYGRDLIDQAPVWLQNMRGVGKYAQSAIDPVTGMIDPTKGEIAFADMVRVVVPVVQKVSMGVPLTQGEANLLGGAIEDAWMQDHMFFDNIVDEIARSMQMIDPDQFGAFTEVEEGGLAADDSTSTAEDLSPDQLQRKLARQAAVKLLESYGITEAMMENHKQTRLDYEAQQMLARDKAKEDALKAGKKPAPERRTRESVGHNQ